MSNKISLSKIDDKVKDNFLEKVQEQYVKKYANAMVGVLEDKRKLEQALASVNKVIKSVEDGDYSVIDKYVRVRQRLEGSNYGDLDL